MLTGLKVSYKCAFNRPEYNAKEGPHEIEFEGLEVQRWNIADGKNGVVFLVIPRHSQSYGH